ncbi:MAG: hypothetical protein HYY17_15905 [Planctomycetes bacterium]|nr:hypothetical protein [Planctomycetota bacterium]
MSEKQILAITGGVLGVVLLFGGAGVYWVKFVKMQSTQKEIAKVQGEIKTGEFKQSMLVDPKREAVAALETQIQENAWDRTGATVDMLRQAVAKTAKGCAECAGQVDKVKAAVQEKNGPGSMAVVGKIKSHLDTLHPDRSLKGLLNARKEKGTTFEGKVPPYAGEERRGEPVVDLEYDIFFNHIDRLRRQAGVLVPSGKFVPPKRAAPGAKQVRVPASMQKADFELICVGSFYQLLRFLNLLETAQRHVTVETFQITAGKSVGVAYHSLRLNLYTFSFQGAAPGTAPKKEETTPISTTVTSKDLPD